jgi:general secretion pathway protein N
MRLDRLAPRTWLLATVAAWALVSWLLAVAGMGANAALLPADASLLQPLPQVQPAGAQRLRPLAAYGAVVARPLFANDRRPHPFSLAPQGDDDAPAANSFDYILTSVVIAPQLHMAIIQPSAGGDAVRVRLGGTDDAIPGWQLAELQPRSAVFEGPGGRRELLLRTYAGVGGEAPSSSTNARGRDGRATDADADASADDAAQAADAAEGAARAPTPTQVQSQMEAIRNRIESRRAQLRQQATQPNAPARKP